MTRTPPEVSRRSMLRGLAVGGLGLPLLAACGGGGTTSSGGSTAAPSGTSDTGGGASSGGTLATTAEVPVGGGTILTGQQVVLTQPAKGDFKAFSAICTHQGCTVSQITKGAIVCPCHGSQFSIRDGSVLGGPAPSPLPPVRITVKANKITRA
jgi:nitrite reductase/ring-hydroxylating ferredoxin subunit